jgi:acetyl esterase/lipase
MSVIWRRPRFSMMASASIANAQLSGTLTAVSDYDFRGVTQSAQDPALQGSIDWAADSGLYLGAWASNIDFGDSFDADIEVDLYGGFTGGDKHRPGDFRYDNVMIWAVRNGMVGAELNYRLAPKHVYPDANDDVAAGIKYIRDHARDHGGDPDKIVVWGHSAGASLVGIFVSHPEFLKASGGTLAAALMTSGAYEFTAPHVYLGHDAALVAKRSSVEGLKKSDIPLFFTRAEWDPAGTMQQGDSINKALCDAGKCPTFVVMNAHNHMSQVYSINTVDKELAGHILGFIQRTTGIRSSTAAP